MWQIALLEQMFDKAELSCVEPEGGDPDHLPAAPCPVGIAASAE
jgi:hypothetical protein